MPRVRVLNDVAIYPRYVVRPADPPAKSTKPTSSTTSKSTPTDGPAPKSDGD